MKFLTRLADGTIKLISAISSGGTSNDANKIVETNAQGKLSNTLTSNSQKYSDFRSLAINSSSVAISADDEFFQYLEPLISAVEVILPSATLCPGRQFHIINKAASEGLSLYFASANLYVSRGGFVLCHSDGVDWNYFVYN